MKRNLRRSMRGLKGKARASGSSAVVMWREGRPLLAWHDAGGWRPIELMSVTKMIVGVVIGAALGDEGVAALSTPVATWFPEWKNDRRSAITLRHVLTHTSGLEVLPSAAAYAAHDAVQLALDRPLALPPGSAYRYSNTSFNLAAGIVARLTGRPLDEVADEKLFGPLGFRPWAWQRDAAGNPLCMAGLSVRADDVAKIGEVLLRGGRWGKRQLVPASWVDAMPPRGTADVGLACFTQHEVKRRRVTAGLLDAWVAAGVDPQLVDAVRPHVHGDADPEDWRRELGPSAVSQLAAEVLGRGLRLVDQEIGPALGFGHDGDLGQHFAVMPGERIVAVRLRENRGDARQGGSWPTFLSDARRAALPRKS